MSMGFCLSVCPSVRPSVRYVRHVCACAKSRDMYFVIRGVRLGTRIVDRQRRLDNGNGIDVREKHLKRVTKDGLNTLRHHKGDCVNCGVGYHKHIV